MKTIGRFCYNDIPGTENYMPKTMVQRLREIEPLVDDAFIETLLLPLNDKRAKVSLRVLDWCCVNYALKHNASYKLQRNKTEMEFYIYEEYRKVCKARRRRLFDPFRRKVRVRFTHGDMAHETTVAQLAFLLWARDNGVWDYTLSNATKIEEDMRETLRQNRERAKKNRKRKREKLTKQPTAHLALGSSASVYCDNSDEEDCEKH